MLNAKVMQIGNSVGITIPKELLIKAVKFIYENKKTNLFLILWSMKNIKNMAIR